MKRKAIPPSTCEYMIRMHLKSIEALSKYMAGGCGDSALNDSLMACVGMIELRNALNKTLDQYSV